mmetsp:Transcript_80955/g.158178  ORF Transcript_80955/g.158178 Transcript_80955/m.158178 type:complete len:654 (-) Transcript_80955:281-2242(-)|eukprot:CAMPEP_0171938222 /NCGR_PEP_ID=MMETSP0993-20121228/35260_1 /TAXON_ID=483369 /ORGANISM="non described non described, Strain CCMP2098" /LENGTH=653 /DNA_ID=CAMNT_0012579733 /DNA_START=95 /DNA_END=2056 /DNA_ORIENTATION=+
MTWSTVSILVATLVTPPASAFLIPHQSYLRTSSLKSVQEVEEVDVVVVGSGLAGLSCAALLASRGLSVSVLEAHYELGGCAHDWAVGMDGKPIPSDRLKALEEKGEKPPVFRFEAGPSLFSGLSPPNSPNPLKSVFQMIEEEPEWITYDVWGAHLPEVPEGYALSIGAENFKEILGRYGGPTALQEWESLAAKLRPLSKGVMGLPSAAVRSDWGVLLTLGLKYPLALATLLKDAPKVLDPFNLDEYQVTDPFLRNYMDLLAFLLQGMPADETLTVVMAYMLEDFYRPNAVLEYPKGGSGGIVAALRRGVEKHAGCSVRTRQEVGSVLVEGGRAVGVTLKATKKQPLGKQIRARKAVVSNADLYGTFNLVPRGASEEFDNERDRLLPSPPPPPSSEEFLESEEGGERGKGVPLCKSFMHLHLAVRADLLDPKLLDPSDLEHKLPPQWTVVNSWEGPIDSPGKVVVVSCGSLLDQSMAPEGFHVIHAYTAGNEPFEIWEKFLDKKKYKQSSSGDGVGGGTEDDEDTAESIASYRFDPEYVQLKEERAAPLWDAIARRIPNIRDPGVCAVVQVGTPLTHSRFLKRHKGNYGLAIAAGNAEGLAFPGLATSLPGFYRCGDSTTAGIGVPAVASSGAQCANAILSVWDQLEMNKKIRL